MSEMHTENENSTNKHIKRSTNEDEQEHSVGQKMV